MSLFNYRADNGKFKPVPILNANNVQAIDITGDGVKTEFELVHNRGTLHVFVQMLDLDNNMETVEATTLRMDENTVKIVFGIAPEENKKYRVIIM